VLPTVASAHGFHALRRRKVGSVLLLEAG